MDLRRVELASWAAHQLQVPEVALSLVSGDASFRRYFRVTLGQQSWIAMDAPPDKEDSHPFVAIARHWRAKGILVPEIVACDLAQGFLLLTDFGDQLLLSKLNPAQPAADQGEHFYGLAMNTLCAIQRLDAESGKLLSNNYALPSYDRALLDREMALFRDWLVGKKLALELTPQEHLILDRCFQELAENALSQPQVPVHRDYHARNLMILSPDALGILDFQDAVQGPITYDLVSLLRDCYIVWPESLVERWCMSYHNLLSEKGLVSGDFEQFRRWFDLMGMQRHLKAAGIFARLSLRDGKHGYLADIPRTVNYIVNVGARYPSMRPLVELIETKVVPQFGKLGSS